MSISYKDQLKSPEWQKKRLKIFERDNFTCQLCLDTKEQLHVHHKSYSNGKKAWEYDNDNFLTLCMDCHDIFEFCKKELDVEIINIYCIKTNGGTKVYMVSKSSFKGCIIFEFRQNGEINGKEIVFMSPLDIMNDIYNFLNQD